MAGYDVRWIRQYLLVGLARGATAKLGGPRFYGAPERSLGIPGVVQYRLDDQLNVLGVQFAIQGVVSLCADEPWELVTWERSKATVPYPRTAPATELQSPVRLRSGR